MKSNRHLDAFFRLGCRSNLVNVFPNPKELTESFAVYAAVTRAFGFSVLKDRGVLCICPADGVSPRTGATAALRSAWTVKSIDPKMGLRWVRGKHAIKRLSCIRSKAECLRYEAERVLILATHSHADLPRLIERCEAERVDVVSLPCCVPDRLGVPALSWSDPDCLSPARTINVYLDVRVVAQVASAEADA